MDREKNGHGLQHARPNSAFLDELRELMKTKVYAIEVLGRQTSFRELLNGIWFRRSKERAA